MILLQGLDWPWSCGTFRALLTFSDNIMLQFLLGFTFGNMVGMNVAQNYDIPNLAKNEEIKKLGSQEETP
jgi:hypothetical protein